MGLIIALLTPPPVPEELECNAVGAYRWLLESWSIRLRWIALLLGTLAVPFITSAPWPLLLACPLTLLLGNSWLVWCLRRAAVGTCLRQIRAVATGLDWALGLVALGMSSGTGAHEALPALLLLLILATGLRYGLNGLCSAVIGSACLTAFLIGLHVVLMSVLTWRAAAGVLVGWELMIGLTALLGWGPTGGCREWHYHELTHMARDAGRWETGLTKREWELLPLLARDELTYAAIAGQLHIGRETVKTHAHRLGTKLGTTKRWGIVFEARRRGWLPSQER